MAFGLKPVRYKDGAPYNGAANVYYVPASDATALFIGDPVVVAGSGDADGVPSVTRAAAGANITGVVVGFAPLPTGTAGSDSGVNIGYRAASTEDYVLVADGTELLFEVIEDAVGGALAAADIGLNADLVAATGSTYTKQSGCMLDSSTEATTSAQMRIVALSPRANNTVGGTDAVWLVSIIESAHAPASGTTGV